MRKLLVPLITTYPIHPLSNNSKEIRLFRTSLSMAAALGLLGLFIGWNAILDYRSLHDNDGHNVINEKEQLPDTTTLKSARLAFHDFESGNADDTALHLVKQGHSGKQSMRISSKAPFSPGLWIKFKDLRPGDSSWMRVTGYAWFSCPVPDAKGCLVATCNHRDINYKYMSVPVEKEAVKPFRWNLISIDYLIPPAPDSEDVLKAYFWYRGNGEMLVDDIEIQLYKPL